LKYYFAYSPVNVDDERLMSMESILDIVESFFRDKKVVIVRQDPLMRDITVGHMTFVDENAQTYGHDLYLFKYENGTAKLISKSQFN